MFAHEGERFDRRSLLQSQLPRRLARLRRRGERLREGWDVNHLVLLGEDAGFLAAALRRCGSDDAVAEALAGLEAAIAPLLDPPRPPDQASMDRIAARLDALAHFEPTAIAEPAVEEDLPSPDASLPDDWPFWTEPDPFSVPVATPAPPPLFDEVEDAQPEIPIAAAGAAEPSIAAERGSDGAPTDIARDETAGLANEAPPPDALEMLLRAALDGEGLELTFQAIVPLHGEAREQFQALLRLRDGDGRMYAAADLIPVAERAGLLGAIDRWVLERCIALIAQRLQAGRSMRLFINQSLPSVRNAWATTRVERLLREYGVAAPSISLELRADAADLAPIDVVRYAHAVKALGCGFVLSAFEAGETGERLLAALPFDAVRLSPRYLQLADATAREELRELVERLHEQGRSVIAPRVEDARVASALWSAGVDYVQGNFVQAADGELGFDFRGSLS